MTDPLVQQKNELLTLVNDGQYEQASTILDFLTPSWTAQGYGYKVKEIKERIRRELDNLAFHADHHQTEAKWKRLKERLCA